MNLTKKTYKFKVEKFLPLTDTQWSKIQHHFEKTNSLGRPSIVDLRLIVDGLRYIIRTGVQWRNVPQKYGKSATLRYYWDKCRKDKTWSNALKTLVCERRQQLARNTMPTVGAIAAANRRQPECQNSSFYPRGRRDRW